MFLVHLVILDGEDKKFYMLTSWEIYKLDIIKLLEDQEMIKRIRKDELCY